MGVDNACLRVKAYVPAGQGLADEAGSMCQGGVLSKRIGLVSEVVHSHHISFIMKPPEEVISGFYENWNTDKDSPSSTDMSTNGKERLHMDGSFLTLS